MSIYFMQVCRLSVLKACRIYGWVVLAINSKGVFFYFLLRCTKDLGGPGNPLSPIGANAFCTTNFQC